MAYDLCRQQAFGQVSHTAVELSCQMEESDQLLSGCNDEQREAVIASRDRHLLVLAGAGCGKTMVLTRRVVHLSICGIPLESLLALTFTRKAADEMAGRVAELTKGVSGQRREPTITTFHAFALQVLSASFGGTVNFNRIGFSGTPRSIDEKERLHLLAECTTPEERRSLECDLASLDSLLERYHLTPERVNSLPEDAMELVRSISLRVRQRKREMSVWDFSDLIEGVVELLSGNAAVADGVRQRYRAVLVDEFQDTNPLQVRLLHLLLADGKKLFAVGDDDQAIYGFRGADIGPTMEFATCFPGARILKLQTNYRSTPAILSKANRIFRNKDPVYRKELVSGRYPKGSGVAPEIHRCGDQEEMVRWITAKARECAEELQVPGSEMAILVRTNQSAERIGELLDAAVGTNMNRPQVLTVHKSKGLEFPVVFLADMEECVFPGYRKPSGQRINSVPGLLKYLSGGKRLPSEEELSEEVRLFYVAVTRARQRLFLLYSRTKKVYGRTRRFEPSRFLKYMR